MCFGCTRMLHSSMVFFLIVEIPVESDAQDASVDGVVRSKEIVALPAAIDVAHHYVEAACLQLEIGVYVADRVVSNLGSDCFILLNHIRLHLRAVFRSVVFGEISYVGT